MAETTTTAASDWREHAAAIQRELETMTEVLARLGQMARESQRSDTDAVAVGSTMLDLRRCELHIEGSTVTLTPSELKILRLLLAEPGRVWSRETLMRDAFGNFNPGQSRNVDAHLNRLRKKLGAAALHLEGVYGHGYRWKTEATPCQ